MNNQEIIDNAPEGAEFTSSMGYLWNDNEDWFIYGATTEEWNHLFFHEYSFSDWKIRSLADIKRIVELEACLIKIRELLAGQKDKSCLGTGYPSNENDCSPWPIVDEAVNNITQALKVGIKQ